MYVGGNFFNKSIFNQTRTELGKPRMSRLPIFSLTLNKKQTPAHDDYGFLTMIKIKVKIILYNLIYLLFRVCIGNDCFPLPFLLSQLM